MVDKKTPINTKIAFMLHLIDNSKKQKFGDPKSAGNIVTIYIISHLLKKGNKGGIRVKV